MKRVILLTEVREEQVRQTLQNLSLTKYIWVLKCVVCTHLLSICKYWRALMLKRSLFSPFLLFFFLFVYFFSSFDFLFLYIFRHLLFSCLIFYSASFSSFSRLSLFLQFVFPSLRFLKFFSFPPFA